MGLKSDESQLLSDLKCRLCEEEKFTRPTKCHTDVVKVTVGLWLVHVGKYDENAHELDCLVYPSLSWTDFRLAWNPEDYDGIKSMNVPSRYLWIPDIMFFNSASDIRGTEEYLAIVSHDGTVLIIPKVKVCIPCVKPSSATEVNALLILGSWTYNEEQLDLIASKADDTNVKDDFWKVESFKEKRISKKYPGFPDSYVSIEYELKITAA